MNKLLTALAISIIVCIGAECVSAEMISGIVLDAESKSALAGATVSLNDGAELTLSDNEGRFKFDISDSTALVTISHIGFVTQRSIPLIPGSEIIVSLAPTLSVLNSISVTANRYEKESYKVSQSITSASSREIESHGYTLVSDIIREFPGVDINDAGPFRARPVIRGLFGTRVLVLVDGARLNDQRDVLDFAGISMSLIDVSEIDRVEVVNGPSSVLYGSDAMAGVINIITKRNSFSAEVTPILRYSSRYSTVDQQSSNRLDVGIMSEKVSFSVGFKYREANKNYKAPNGYASADSRYGIYRQEFYDSLNAAQGTSYSGERFVNSRARINNYDARLSYKPSERHRLDFNFGALRGSDIGFPGLPNDSFPFLFMWPNHDRDNFSVTYTGIGLTKRMTKLNVKVYYEKISKDFFIDFLDAQVIPAGPPPNPPLIIPQTSLSSTKVEKLGFNFQELYRVSSKTLLTFGFDSWREEIRSDVISITRFVGFPQGTFNDTAIGPSVPDNDWKALGVYVAGETHLDDVQFNAGLRWDNFWVNARETPGYVDDNDVLLNAQDANFSAVNGSLGIVFPLGKGVNAVGNLGSAFRAPNVVERYFYGRADGNLTRPNPNIKPERGVTIDLGFKGVHKSVNYSVIGFRSNYTDFVQLLTFDTSGVEPLWRFENVGDVTISGFEALVEGFRDNGMHGSLGLTYQYGNNNTEDSPVFVSPFKTDAKVGYRHNKHGLFSELHMRWIGDQNRVPTVATLTDQPTNGYTLFHFNAGVTVWNQVRLSATIRNVFDKIYSEPFNARSPNNPLVEPGRNFILSLNTQI